VSALPSHDTAAGYVRAGGRLVLVNRDAAGLPATVIVNDNARIGRELAQKLLAGGHTRIAMVRGDALLASGLVRASALREAVAASGRARIIVDRTGALGYDAGRAFGNEMMARDERPDVIVCSTDMTAIGVLDAVRIDRGLEVPRDVGVAGFGDTPASGWASHALTTVRLPLERMIDEAVATVLADAAPPLTAPRLVVVDGEIVVRSTLRPAPPTGATGPT
jgi:LacI family transcriptional regulator